ncbi:FkbM family methyltransferase [Catalinimonas sp. 4WD22]|uniref:FkbM family methyltransferase n=1 Tax=Catalinimonas locisalis TaxID=3133978 RepID=UPI003100D3C4
MSKFSELQLIINFPFQDNLKVLVDVGAHQGGFSKKFAQLNWKVISFEPENSNHEAFKKNLYGFENVQLINKAVSDQDNLKVPFFVSNKHYGIHSLKPFHDTHKAAYEVETITLNTALESLEVDKISLLKVDTEGADFLALKGFNFNKYKPELIMVEFMDNRSIKNFGYSHHDMVLYMKDFGYKSFVSEWAPIKEYGIQGVNSEPHTWLQCKEYPLNHDPSWGNLIFIPNERSKDFYYTYNNYLNTLKSGQSSALRTFLKKIPGVKWFYNSFLR